MPDAARRQTMLRRRGMTLAGIHSYSLSLMLLLAFLWAGVEPATAADGGHFGVDGFGSYLPGTTPLSDLMDYFDWEVEQIAGAGFTWNRTLSPAGGQFSWNRIEGAQGTYSWEVADALVTACQEKNIRILALVHPYTLWDQPGKTDRDYSKPNDISAFQDFLRAMVERYDGDGANDMPALKSGYAVKHWEISNEPEFGLFGGSSAGPQQYQDYYDTLRVAHDAIKSADPEAKILNAGTSPIYDPVTGALVSQIMDFWDNVILDENLGGGSYIDILNIHYVIPEPGPSLEEFILQWQKFNDGDDKEIWVTETGAYAGQLEKDGSSYPEQSEEEQARWWIKHCCYGLAHGVTTLFWATFYHGPYTPDLFEYTAMVNSDETTKLVYTSQGVMASKIDDFISVEEVAHSDTAGRYKFMVGEDPVYVLWDESNPVVDLSGDFGSGEVSVTDAFGNVSTPDASAITLSSTPIFVELIAEPATPPGETDADGGQDGADAGGTDTGDSQSSGDAPDSVGGEACGPGLAILATYVALLMFWKTVRRLC